MKGKSLKLTTYIFPLLIIALTSSGCSVIGVGVGSIIDSKSPHIRINPLNELEKIESGERITVVMKEGGEIKGEYGGIAAVENDDMYIVCYADVLKRNADKIHLPAIGDTLTIYLKPAKNKVYMERIFLGFDFKSDPNHSKKYLKYKYLSTPAVEDINLEFVHKIVAKSGDEIKINEVCDFISSGGLNDVTALILKTRNGNHNIALSSINIITQKPERKMTRILGVVGLVADMIVYAILKTTSERGASSSSGGG